MRDQNIGGVLFKFNNKLISYGIPSIYSTRAIIRVPFSNLLTVHDLETKEIERQYYGNFRGSFAPIVRKDHIVFLGGIHFPVKLETNYCTEITKVTLDSSKKFRSIKELFSDVKIIIGEKEYHLHRFIIFPLTCILPNLLKDNVIKMKEDPKIFENILDYLYDMDDKIKLKGVLFKGVLLNELKIDKKKNKMELYKYPQLSDCIIGTNDSKTFVCHKLLLCHYSEYFYLLFTGNYSDSKDKNISLDVPSNLFKYFYNFIYLEKINITSCDHAFELLEFSTFLISKSFEKFIIDILEQMVNTDNSIHILINLKERNFNYPSLKRKCTEMIKSTLPYENLLDLFIERITLKKDLVSNEDIIVLDDEEERKKKKQKI